jgi:DNA polymerase-3 subunit epsilon
MMPARQIILDTETTGLDPTQGHRIIEIGCVELVNRRPTGNNYHQYLNPEREIDQGAIDVHGITNEFLQDKPRFADIADDFLQYLSGAELVIHNAPFDVGFIDYEFRLLGGLAIKLGERCSVVDTLQMARKLHPGQKNDLDSLCRRYEVDNTQRTLHGALLDAEILADVYMAMTGGQTGLFEDTRGGSGDSAAAAWSIRRLPPDRARTAIVAAEGDELAAHEAWVAELDAQTEGGAVWRRIFSS